MYTIGLGYLTICDPAATYTDSPGLDVFLYWIGVVLLPAGLIGLIASEQLMTPLLAKAHLLVSGCLIIYIVLSSDVLFLGGRPYLANRAIGPLLQGAIGCNTILLAIGGLKLRTTGRLIEVAGVFTGLILVVLSGSRTALIGSILGVCYIYASSSWSNKIKCEKQNLLLFGCAIAATILLFWSRLFARFIDELPLGLNARYVMWKDAYNQIVASPFWPNSYTVQSGLTYPHNFLADAALTTGIVGLCLFLLTVSSTILAPLRRHAPDPHVLSGALLVGHFAQGMTGGALYLNSYFWISIGLVIFSGVHQSAEIKYQPD